MKTMTQKSLLLATMAASSLLLTACGSGSTTDNNDGAPEGLATTQALFRPAAGVLPLPTNFLFAAQQGDSNDPDDPDQVADGTLNIPSTNPAAIAISQLDGWSTIAPIQFLMNTDIDPASIQAGDNVRVFNICYTIAPPPGQSAPVPTGLVDPARTVGPDGELEAGTDYSVSVAATNPKQLLIKPLRPFRPAIDLLPTAGGCNEGMSPPSNRNAYIVIINDTLAGTNGEAFTPSFSYQIAKGGDELYDQDIEDGAVAQAEAAGTPQGDATADFIRINGLAQARTPFAIDSGFTTPSDARQLEAVRGLTNGVEGISAQAFGANPANIIVSTVFSTQSVGPQLNILASNATPRATAFTNTGMATPGGAAVIHTGTIDLPYYLGLPSATRPLAPTDDPWCVTPIAEQDDGSFDCDTPPTLITAGMGFSPRATATLSVPVLATVPSGMNAPAAGDSMPVVIFQHGITQDKTNLLAIADALAGAGLVAIAIDHPLHGERTFDLNGDDVADIDSAAYFNLVDLVVGRDNLRQSVIDIFNLAISIPTMQLQTTAGGTDMFTIDGGTTYLGHSLGGIVGVPLMAITPPAVIGAGTLAMPGGGIAKLLDASPGFGPVVSSNLASAGAPEGSANYETFLNFAQTTIDSADPANWAAVLAATTADPRRAVHLIEVVGNLDDGGSNPPDQTVPNDADEANPPGPGETTVVESGPLGGTDPLIALLGLDIFVADPASPTTSSDGGAVRFTAGDHASILLPNADCLTWFEMQTEAATFLATNGALLPIGSSNATGTGTATCEALGF